MSNTRDPDERLHDARMEVEEMKEHMDSEQESAEVLGKRIEDMVCEDTFNGDWDATRREYAALIEADRAATRRDERRKALEDACREIDTAKSNMRDEARKGDMRAGTLAVLDLILEAFEGAQSRIRALMGEST